jgi:hypothetical protein
MYVCKNSAYRLKRRSLTQGHAFVGFVYMKRCLGGPRLIKTPTLAGVKRDFQPEHTCISEQNSR